MMHVIWDEDIDIEDWIDDDGNQMSYVDAECLNYEYLNDERENLNIDAGGIILCIAELGLWDGKRSAYKILGNYVSDILCSRLECCSTNMWYDNGKNIHHQERHHDGTNYYIYRVVKGNTKQEQLNNIEKLFSKPLNNRRIGSYTKSLSPIVREVYGY